MRLRALVLLLFALIYSLSLHSEEKLSTEELINNLKDDEAKVRIKAAKELGDRGEKLGLEALLEATRDKDAEVQMAVVEALGKISHSRQVSYLSQAAKNTKGDAQKEALRLLTRMYIPSRDHGALGKLWNSLQALFDPPELVIVEPWIRVDPEAIDAITFVLDQKESENRIEAAAILGILRAQPAAPRLVFYLKSPNKEMVQTSIRSLGYIGDAGAAPDLVPLLKHPEDDVVIDAIRVLGQLRYKEALPELFRMLEASDEDSDRRPVLQAISRIADPAYEPTMLKFLDSDDKLLRLYAIEGIGRMNLQKHTQTLQLRFQREKSRALKLGLCFSLYSLGESAYIDTLVLNLKDEEYRNQAQSYLVELGPRAVPGVAAYLKASDDDFRVTLLDLLGNMHEPSAIPFIEPYLKDEDLDTAEAATHAIRKLRRIQELKRAG